MSTVLLHSFSFASQIAKHIKQSDFDKNTKVSLYAINKQNSDILYKKNENLALNPASTLKPLTFGLSYLILGANHAFETSLYEDKDNNFYIKLGGDVLLTQDELNKLASNLKNKKINNIYIDDTIFDKTPYPQTWQEEDKWPNFNIISPYIIDNNATKISIKRSSLTSKVDISQDDDYKIPIIKELKLSDSHCIKIARPYGETSPIISLQGTVSKDEEISIPILNPEINFNIKLNQALKKNDVIHLNRIETKKTPQDATKIASVGHSINEISKLILHNSNNFASEVVFKVAASKYYNKEAGFDDAVKMFNEHFEKYLSKNEKIADASGVSRQNLLSTKTILNIFLDIQSKTDILSLLPTSSEGTLKERLLFLSGNLKAKTGSLRDYSSLLASIKTRKNTDILFVSIVQNSTKRKSLLKNYENTLLGLIYKKY